MKILKEVNYNSNTKFLLQDTLKQENYVLKNYSNVKKMPNEYFYNKYGNEKNKVWVLYGRDSCPYCKNSIKLLNNLSSKNNVFIYVNIESSSLYTKSIVIKNLKNKINNHTTVPIIFCNNKFIGGNSDLEKLLK